MSYPPNQDGYTQPYYPPQQQTPYQPQQHVPYPPQQPAPYQPQQPPPAPQWQQAQPWQPPPPTPPNKGRGWLWVVVSVVGLISFCLVLGAIQNFTGHGVADNTNTAQAVGGTTATTAPSAKKPATKATTKAAAAPGIGDKVRDGKFEFTVTGLDCSKSRVGDEYLHADAQGKYCVVSLTVVNIGSESQMFTGAAQKAYDIGGAEYTDDGGAEFYVNKNADTFLNEINPGNSVKGKVVFDVPKKTTLTTIELHDSVWSGGTKVSLH